uniref:Uncharacterized protein n=1 Tax=Vespula pensylvanica TaxID=30213 RepID=A0A834U3S0_VESPE|nr:hypothetical protein H0235_012167 [Vespula pensylvanica]
MERKKFLECALNRIKRGLTRIENHFADHDPSGGKMESQFHVLANTMVKLDGDVTRRFKYFVLHVGVGNRLTVVVSPAYTEEYVDLREDLRLKKRMAEVQR